MSFYFFVNVSKNIDDIAGKTDILNIGVIELFSNIIHANNWKFEDTIIGFPEKNSDPIIRYSEGDIEFKMEDNKNVDLEEDENTIVENTIVENAIGENAIELDIEFTNYCKHFRNHRRLP